MKIEGIQALRALAAYLVLFFHVTGNERLQISLAEGSESPLFGTLFNQGFVGVDLFFVISGFIMAYVTHDLTRGLGGVKQFMLARLFRIYPVWWLFAGILAILSLVMAGTLWHPDAFNTAEGNGYLFMLKSFLLIPQDNLPSLNVGWTLIHEMGFYLVFAALLFLPRKLLPAGLAAWAVVVMAGFVLASQLSLSDATLEVFLSPMSLEFILGAFAGFAFASGFRKFQLPAFIVGLIGAVIAYPLVSASMAEGDRLIVVAYFALPFTLMVYGATGLDAALKENPLFKGAARLGDWSYSLYLCHPIVLLALPKVMQLTAQILMSVGLPASSVSFLLVGSEGLIDNLVFNLLAVLGSTLCAGVTFYIFERPVLRFLNGKFRKQQADKEKARLNETVAP